MIFSAQFGAGAVVRFVTYFSIMKNAMLRGLYSYYTELWAKTQKVQLGGKQIVLCNTACAVKKNKR